MTKKQIKQKYIRSKVITIAILIFVFLGLCIIGRIFDNYIIIGGAVIYAFISYIIFNNKMMTYVEKDETKGMTCNENRKKF